MSAFDLSEQLRAWIENSSGGTIETAEPRPAGGRHEAWLIDVRCADGTLDELFLRRDPKEPESFDPYTLHREAEVYRALSETRVPVPRIVAVHPHEQAVLSERIAGDTWFSRLRDESARLSVAEDFIDKLAALHRLDPGALSLEALGPIRRSSELLHAELDIWEGLYRRRARIEDPMAEFGLDWLRRNIPPYDGPVVLVQGDTGPGNFLYRDGRVTAILDWELAHLGDPMEDIGWLALRAVQEPFTHLPDRLRQYEMLSGHSLDLDRIRYYRVFAELRVVILSLGRDAERNAAGEIGNVMPYTTLHNRLFVEAIAEVLGVALEDPKHAEVERSPHDWLYDAALVQLRDQIVPRITDPFAAGRAKGLARLLKFLREADAKGRIYDAQEQEELSDMLRRTFDSVAQARAGLVQALRDGRVSDQDTVGYLWRRVMRETDLMRSAMGVLADRHFDPLTDPT